MTISELQRVLGCVDDALKIYEANSGRLTVGEIRTHSALLVVRMEVADQVNKARRLMPDGGP
jgi:hypothetical protein